MMKRLTAIFLVLLLLFSATALATGWEEGLGPNQPYSKQPAVDFEKTIGYMMFAPNEKMSVAAAQRLFIYLPRQDVALNSNGGNLVIRSSDKGEEYRIGINDSNYINFRPMIEQELNDLMWGEGVCVEITLPVSLRLGCTYYVDMDERCIIDEARQIGNPVIKSSNDGGWHFTMLSDYGVNELSYLRDGETVVGTAQAGDTARFDVVLGGAAKSAVLYANDTKIVFPADKMLILDSCTVEAEVTGEDPVWDVLFFDTEYPVFADEAETNQHTVDVLEF